MTEELPEKPPKKPRRNRKLEEHFSNMALLFDLGMAFGAGIIQAAVRQKEIVQILQGKEVNNAEQQQYQGVSQEKGGGDSTISQEENATESCKDS